MSQLKALTKLYVDRNKLPLTDVDFITKSFPQLTALGLSGMGLTQFASEYVKIHQILFACKLGLKISTCWQISNSYRGKS